ncbi:hypothetical protein [Kitasatospora sp. NPDC004272]
MLHDACSDDADALRRAWPIGTEQCQVPPGSAVVLGFDGFHTELGIASLRAETLDGYQFTPTYGPQGLLTVWSPADWGGQVPRLEVHAALDELMDRYTVVRGYFNPSYWEGEIDAWSAKYGEKRIVRWPTYRRLAMRAAFARLLAALSGNALRHDNQTKPDRAAVLAHEAACDATAMTIRGG